MVKGWELRCLRTVVLGNACAAKVRRHITTEHSARFMQSTRCTMYMAVHSVHATRCIQMIKRWVKCWFNEAEGNSFIISSLCKVLPWTRATIAAWTFEVGCDGADSVWPLNAKHWHYTFHSSVRSRTSIYISFLTCRNHLFFFGGGKEPWRWLRPFLSKK